MADGAITLDEDWVAEMVAASSSVAGNRSGVVAVAIGKKQQAVLNIEDGRVVGTGDEDAVAVTVPVTSDQLTSFVDGSESVAKAYMRGDLKPVGSTGALLAFVELFENPEFRQNLAG
jgi:putative sterol carrier protein